MSCLYLGYRGRKRDLGSRFFSSIFSKTSVSVSKFLRQMCDCEPPCLRPQVCEVTLLLFLQNEALRCPAENIPERDLGLTRLPKIPAQAPPTKEAVSYY